MINAKENWSFVDKEPLYWKKLCGDHGGIKDEEIHNTLIMHGPDFMEGEKVKESVIITCCTNNRKNLGHMYGNSRRPLKPDLEVRKVQFSLKAVLACMRRLKL